MEDVRHPRLHKRNGVYYLRASFPADLALHFNARERWKSLSTRDHGEALRKVRAASAAFDVEMDKLRLGQAAEHAPPRQLDQREVAALAGQWYREAIERWESMPGPPPIWKKLIDTMSRLDTREKLHREMQPFVEEVLAQHSIGKIDDDSRERLMEALRGAIHDAARTLERRANNDFGPDLIAQRFPKLEKEAPTVNGSLRLLTDEYLADPGAKRNAKTLLSYRIVFDALIELVGPDKAAADVTPRDCERVRDFLLKLPKNARKHYPKKSLMEASRLAEADGRALISVGTINSYLNNLSSLFNWAEGTWRIPRNPAKKLQLPDPVKAKNKRHPIPIEDLPAPFNAPLYVGCVNDEAGYAKPGPNRPRRGRFWVPLLSLFHGLRQGEACQLHADDVRQIGGVWCLMLSEENPDDMEQEDRKRIKTEAGERFVPLHQELIAMGFLDFVAQTRTDSKRLFPELERNKYGYFDEFSKWFGRFLTKVGVKKPRITFHSLRHNYRDALRRAMLPRDIIVALGGWGSDGVDDDYGGDAAAFIPALAASVAKVSFPGLDLSHLHVQSAPAAMAEKLVAAAAE